MPEPDTRPFAELVLRDFVARLASSEPVPGGGSASAIAGSLAAGLVGMVAGLSDRPRYAEHAALHEAAGSGGRRLADRLLRLADEDAAAYAAYAATLKLPKETDGQRRARDEAKRAAARGAATVPLACVEACLEVVTLAEALAGRSNANAASDLGVAALLAEAAANGAAENVRVNLPALDDATLAGDFERRVTTLMERMGSTAARVREHVASGESRPPLEAAYVETLARIGAERDAAREGGA